MFIFISMMAVLNQAFAGTQDINIYGKTVNATTGVPISGLVVGALDSAKRPLFAHETRTTENGRPAGFALTSRNGSFSLGKIEPSKNNIYMISIEGIGYPNYKFGVSVKPGTSIYVTLPIVDIEAEHTRELGYSRIGNRRMALPTAENITNAYLEKDTNIVPALTVLSRYCQNDMTLPNNLSSTTSETDRQLIEMKTKLKFECTH